MMEMTSLTCDGYHGPVRKAGSKGIMLWRWLLLASYSVLIGIIKICVITQARKNPMCSYLHLVTRTRSEH